jgi:cytidine deaminase
MSHAWNASLQSTDLSRQVGAVIATKEGALIVTGYNEVPKFGGGVYRDEDYPNDHRDFRHGIEINKKKKKELLIELINETKKTIKKKLQAKLSQSNLSKIDALSSNILFSMIDDQDEKPAIFDLIEYHRAIHAELAAICDAARRGISIMGGTLYTTTFPCHLCAKHIVAAGISKVIYVHPYPKSKAIDLFKDSIAVNSNILTTNKVEFIPYMGVAPRRIQKVFNWLKGKREDSDGNSVDWSINDKTSPFLDYRTPLGYYDRETTYLVALQSVENLDHFILSESGIIKIISSANLTNSSTDVKKGWAKEELKDKK